MAPKQQQSEQPEPLYPTIESFIEAASAEDVGAAFEQVRAGLATLKGPRAEQGKKVAKSIERTEALLSYLLQVREKIQAERAGRK